MPRNSTLETRTPAEPIPGATDVVEAATAEEALAEVHDRLGPDARILDARRVLRGGIGGFFAKEVVQLHAAGPDTPCAPAPVDTSAPAPVGSPATLESAAALQVDSAASMIGPDISAASAPVDRLLAEDLDIPETVDFATYLRRQLVDPPTGGPAASPPSVPAPSSPAHASAAAVPPAAPASPWLTWPTTEPAAPASPPQQVTAPTPRPVEEVPCEDGVAWSAQALTALGLPVELVRGLEVGPAADDLAWTTALADALRPSCRPLPTGPSVMLGPLASLIGAVDGTPTARSETWLKALRPGRWLHLVVGGEGWRAPLHDAPLAVSWARPEDLPDALRCAVELGLVLGFGPMGGRIRRARPLDVALAVRDLVDGS